MTEPAVGTFARLASDEPYPGVVRRTFDAAGATVTSYEFSPGASFPLHRHTHEQITLVDEGSVRMRIGEDEPELSTGGWSVVPGGIEHGVTAGPTGARITAIIVPRRESGAYEVMGS
jgi:quercetin dioxygenase-like cupin family protein